MNNPYFIGLAVLGLINLFLLAILFRQFRKYSKLHADLLRGEQVSNLEDLVLQHKKTLANHYKNLNELGKILEELVESRKRNIQKVGFVRFNPFADAGGNMSFTLALLDGRDSGIVISSLYGREGTRIYAKNLEKGQSKYHLTEEEKQAIAKARGNHSN